MKRLGIISLVLIMGIGFLAAYRANNYSLRGATADSGFDSGFDSGGSSSWDSGGSSSWDSGGSSGGSGSSINYDEDEAAIIVTFIIIMFFVLMAFHLSSLPSVTPTTSSTKKKVKAKDYVPEKLKTYGIDEVKMIDIAYNTYVDIQNAWMDIEIDKVKDKLSDELYNTYKMQLLTLKRKKQRNVMSDFEFVEGFIYDIDDSKDNLSISIDLKVKCRDYLINDENKKVVRGNKNKLWNYEYTIDFLIAKSIEDVLKKCPSCGAELDEEKGSRLLCPYCRTLLVRKSPNLVMTRKHMERQS